jgi:sugar transferase (PEP-CTERM/EpsH1 system associated)
MNILFVTHVPPDQPRDGARLIVYHLARRLAAEHTLYLCSLISPGENRQQAEQLLSASFARSELVTIPTPPRTVKWAASLADDAPLWVRAHDVPALRAAIRQVLSEHSIDVVHCDSGLMAQYADALHALPRVVAPHDSLTSLLEIQARESPHPLARLAARLQVSKMRRYETRTYHQFAGVIVVTPRERQYLQRFAPSLRVSVIPNGVDTDFFAPASSVANPNTIGFLGVMDYVPNQAAVLYFVREILPQVWREIPEATFTIIGRDPSHEIRALAQDPRIHVSGSVPDVRPHLAAARVIVCPIQSIGGIKNKVLEALAMGKPLVATPAAIEGLDARHGQELLLASDAGTFASACVKLLRDDAECSRLAQNARQWALEHTWDETARQYLAVYQDAIESATPNALPSSIGVRVMRSDR